MIYDICIVGAGLWGSAAARHASKPGRAVCLIGPCEPRETDCHSRDIFASYYDAGRQVRKYQGTHDTRCLISMRTFESLKELERTSGIKLRADVGHLFYGHSIIKDKVVPTAKAEAISLSASGVRERFTFLDTRHYGDTAMFFPQDAGYADPRLIVQAQKAVARFKGCDVIDDVVERVEETQSGSRADDEPLMFVVTKRGRNILAKRVLLCTGVFTKFKNLLPQKSRNLNLWVDGTFVVNLEVADGDLERLRTMPTLTAFTDPEWNCYMLPPIEYPDGKTYVKVGAGLSDQTKLNTLEEVKDWFLSAPEQKLVDKLKDILLSVVADFTPVSVHAETCACARTPTTLPYCDMLSPRLGLAVGGNGYGAMLCDEMGRMAADMIAGTDNWNLDVPREHLRAQFIPQLSNL